eukprot:403353226
MNFRTVKKQHIPKEFMIKQYDPSNQNQLLIQESDLEDKKIPAHQRAWKCISQSVIQRQDQHFDKMIQSYKDNDNSIEIKLREFTYGGKSAMELYNQDQTGAISSMALSGHQGSNAFQSTQESVDNIFNSSIKFIQSNPVRAKQFLNQDLSNQKQAQQQFEEFSYAVINEEGNIECRPDLLDKWLESPEGVEFIYKYKLWHLKKEKRRPLEFKKKEVPVVQIPNYMQLMKKRRERENSRYASNLKNKALQNDEELLESFDKLLNQKNQGGKSFLHSKLMVDNEFSRAIRKHLNAVSDSNASQAKIMKESNKKLCNEKINQTLIPQYLIPEHYKTLLQREETQKDELKTDCSIERNSKIRIQPQKDFQINLKLHPTREIRQSLLEVSDYISDNFSQTQSFKQSVQNSRRTELSGHSPNLINRRFSSSGKYRKSSHQNTASKVNQFTLGNDIDLQNQETGFQRNEQKEHNQNMNIQQSDDQGDIITYSQDNQNKIADSQEKDDYEPSIPKLNLTFYNSATDNSSRRSRAGGFMKSMNNSMDMKRSSMTRPLSPIHEEDNQAELHQISKKSVRIKKNKKEEEPEPEIPKTTYEYQKFKTEAIAFMNGAKSAQKLNQVTEKIKINSAYLNFLQEKRKSVQNQQCKISQANNMRVQTKLI